MSADVKEPLSNSPRTRRAVSRTILRRKRAKGMVPKIPTVTSDQRNALCGGLRSVL
jgi:hypothetical protein